MRSRPGILALVVIAVGGVAVWLTRGSNASAWPVLGPAAVGSGVQIRIGANTVVSADLATVNHMGCALAADPADARRLFAASTLGDTYDDIAGYASFDGGASWRLACKRPHGPDEQVADEDIAFGIDGGLFIVNMRTPKATAGTYRYGTPGVGSVDWAWSPDGGLTWRERAAIERYIDRPCLAVDQTAGPFRGRLYAHASIEEPLVFVADNAGDAFGPESTLRPRVRSTRPSNPVVLGSGSVLVTSAVFQTGSDPHLELPVWRSDDGGRRFVQLTANLAGRWRHTRIRSASVFDVFYPRLAADPTSPADAQRVYCVWRDGHSPDESYILFSRSLDGGVTWSVPVIVSEQPAGAGAGPDYAADIPAIAVSKDGIIGIMWYDRRGLGKHMIGTGGVVLPAAGYSARFRVSCDGGRSWPPSVGLNRAPIGGDMLSARYWCGLVAAADGRFHAAWIGDSTGARQVWTAAITVEPPG